MKEGGENKKKGDKWETGLERREKKATGRVAQTIESDFKEGAIE